jgi:hypothetical protein
MAPLSAIRRNRGHVALGGVDRVPICRRSPRLGAFLIYLITPCYYLKAVSRESQLQSNSREIVTYGQFAPPSSIKMALPSPLPPYHCQPACFPRLDIKVGAKSRAFVFRKPKTAMMWSTKSLRLSSPARSLQIRNCVPQPQL